MLVKNKKLISFILLLSMGVFIVASVPQPAKAQWATIDVPTIAGNIWTALTKVWEKANKQVVATAFKKGLATFLNKLAYDSAVYVASAGSGQKGLVNPFSKEALTNLADATAGQFIDELATKTGFTDALGTKSLCEPADLTVKVNLLMSFKKPKEPATPKCSVTKMAQAAKDSAKDNLLELNAGFNETEGGLGITFRSINDDQVFNGTDAQKELSLINTDVQQFIKDLQSAVGPLQAFLTAGGTESQTYSESLLPMLQSIEDGLGTREGDLYTLQTEASECLSDYIRLGPVCGNNVTTSSELCDVGGSGNAYCRSDCYLKTTPGGCTGGASDNTKDASEVCDTTVPLSLTCESLGYSPGGSISCDSNCDLNLSCIPKNIITATCTGIPKCNKFVNTMVNPETTCSKNATMAIQYSGSILGTVASYLQQVQDLNSKIEKGEFNDAVTNATDIANAFNPEANELSQFAEIQKALGEKTQNMLEREKLKALAEGPCKGLTKPISGEVVTPSSAACDQINEALKKSTKVQETYTGTIADAFGIFVNTLTAKLMERYFKKGLSMVFDREGLKECKGGKDICGDKTEDILRSGASQGGKAAAELAFGGLLTASLASSGQQDILSILTSCPPEQPMLNNCIIDEPFRRAIEKQMTVKEAMEAYAKSGGNEGLDPKKPFGYILVGGVLDEPDFKNGYSYRSMLYLRKYRIIPVGWELAAQSIKTAPLAQTQTLEEVVNNFSNNFSQFRGMVDPAWVLKSPQVYCAKQGPGPILLSSELQCEKFDTTGNTAACMSDDYQARKVSRAEWCADEQTCLEEGENGECKRYGYCTLERNIWKLGGTQCDKSFASCDGYTNSITKKNYTVLTDTLVKGDCSQSNAGCQWYCQDAPKMCIGGTRAGQPCGTNNDCQSIYCSVGTCNNNSAVSCAYDTDCGTGNICNTGSRICVNGDYAGSACAADIQCGKGTVDGVCVEGGVWSCKGVGYCNNDLNISCISNAKCGNGNTCVFTGDRVNLDRDVKKCEAKDAGCTQFIKVEPGTNLIGNSGFEDDADASLIGTAVNQWSVYGSLPADTKIGHTFVHTGKNSLSVNPDITSLVRGLVLKSYAFPSGFTFDKNKSYTASAWVYVTNAASSSVSLAFGIQTPSPQWQSSVTTQTTAQWERISATVTPQLMATWNAVPDTIAIILTNGSGIFHIDDLQLEEGESASSYVQYGSANTAYLNGQRINCEENEVGCKLYAPASGGNGIPGVINEKDKCPAECSGYKQYRELPSFFSPSRGCRLDASIACVDNNQCSDPGNECLNDVNRAVFQNFIPKTASQCAASAAGCEEFTNLDIVAAGGEAKEYYTKLRQCAKPGTTIEATFYTWEGSEEAGFQLRAWQLKANAGGSPYSTNGAGCFETTDPDCRTFYNQNGDTFQEELATTIFISNDCHPLRKTVRGTRAECAGSGGRSDPAGNSADSDYTTAVVTCLYDAIPSQGVKCAAQYVGCREYRGPTTNNLRVAFEDDFEDLTSQGWIPSYLSSEATTVGGRSYHLQSLSSGTWTMKKSVAGLVEEGKTYVLEFWAKWNIKEDNKDIPGNLLVDTYYINAEFLNSSTYDIPFPQRVDIGKSGEWNRYIIGPVYFPRSPSDNETIEIFPADENGGRCKTEPAANSSPCAGEFYLDNIVLREITDNPFLIKDSWETPVSCVIDPEITKTFSTLPTTLSADITAAEVSNLTVANAAGFDSLSGALAIDGEIIEYQNVAGSTFGTLTRGAKKTAPAAHLADTKVWPVDEAAQLGCEEYKDSDNNTVYLRSFTSLCREDRVGCKEMINTYNSSTMYGQTLKGEDISKDSRELVVDNPKLYCDLSFKGCEKMGLPALDQNGEVTAWGETYLINNPDQYDTIACTAEETMCSEFVNSEGGTVYFKDPKDALCEYHSSINIDTTITKGWFKKGVIPAGTGGLVFYDSDNDGLSDAYAHSECLPLGGVWTESNWTHSCPSDQIGCSEFSTLEVPPQSFYNIKKGVDSASCMGVIDPEKGCVAFVDLSNPFRMVDSRVIGGNAFSTADSTCRKCSVKTINNDCSDSFTCNPEKDNCCCVDTGGSIAANDVLAPPQPPAVHNVYCDANTILKVAQDRQCAEWLACRSIVEVTDSKGNKMKLCTRRQECEAASGSEECDNGGWVNTASGNVSYDPAAVSLRSGYYKAGYYAYGYDTIDGMRQIGYPVGVPNGAIVFEDDFETYQSGAVLPQCATNPIACTGDDPATSADEDTCRTATVSKGICLDYWQSGSPKVTNKEFKFGGQSLLVIAPGNVGSAGAIISKEIQVNANSEYALSVWMNTKDISTPPTNSLVVQVVRSSDNNQIISLSQNQGNDWKKQIRTFTAPSNGRIKIRVYMQQVLNNNISPGSKAYVDMISLAPVLLIQSPANSALLPTNYTVNNIAYSDRSCRLYAKPDALACNYRERNTGRQIQGWRGFCAEFDPKNPEYCLQWWPVDLIAGEDFSKY